MITMRSTIIAALCLLAPALCTPVPMVLVDSLESVAGAAHPPAPIATAQSGGRSPESIGDAEVKYARYPGYDSSHMTPSATMTPSQVLALHQPLETSYLLSINPWFRRKLRMSVQAAEAKEGNSIAAKEWGVEDLEELEALERMRIGMPCYYTQMSRVQRNDLLAVCLVLLFVLVVVLVETFASAKRFCSRRGAIRLREDHVGRDRKQGLSVRADPTGSMDTDFEPEHRPSEKTSL